MNATNSAALNMLGMDTDMQKKALLFAADNIDHNILTIDGKGMLHGMGMIAALTPGHKAGHSIPRYKMQELNIVEKSKVTIIDHHFAKHVLQDITFR